MWAWQSCLPVCVWAQACVFRRSSQSNPDHRDGPCLWLTPYSAWVIKLLEAPCHACPLININYRGSCSLADASSLLSSPLLLLFCSSITLFHPPDWANHWAIRRWSIVDENRYLYHCANDCDVLSYLHPGCYKDVRRFTLYSLHCFFSRSVSLFFFFLHKGWPRTDIFS